MIKLLTFMTIILLSNVSRADDGDIIEEYCNATYTEHYALIDCKENTLVDDVPEDGEYYVNPDYQEEG